MRILVLGATGLIGNSLFKFLSNNEKLTVYGTVKNSPPVNFYSFAKSKNVITELDIRNHKKLNIIFEKLNPNVVINCIGITKHVAFGDDPMQVIPINSYLPHYLNFICKRNGTRLIHISSDCVFSGVCGNYQEFDFPDSTDIYGRSKALGEILDSSAMTIRTSTVGHELNTSLGLLDWFLAQNGSCHGYKNAFFSGLTTLELANVISKYVIPNTNLKGLYHIGGKRISKFNLLTIIAKEYNKNIRIIPNQSLKIDRSLDSSRFYEATGYHPPSWPHLIKELRLNK
jgi:dTDP-4-dehydrorhamnose reductase